MKTKKQKPRIWFPPKRAATFGDRRTKRQKTRQNQVKKVLDSYR